MESDGWNVAGSILVPTSGIRSRLIIPVVISNAAWQLSADQPEKMNEITFDEFLRVELRVGEVVAVERFPEARKPAYKLTIDFGAEIGMKRSSAQITEHYAPEELVGRQVVAVVNFPRKQIGPFMSECLVTGFHDDEGRVLLCVPDRHVPPGTKLC